MIKILEPDNSSEHFMDKHKYLISEIKYKNKIVQLFCTKNNCILSILKYVEKIKLDIDAFFS